jgi:hypothetical protein
VITVPVKILLTSEVRAETREEAREQAKRWLALIPYLLLLSPLPTQTVSAGTMAVSPNRSPAETSA